MLQDGIRQATTTHRSGWAQKVAQGTSGRVQAAHPCYGSMKPPVRASFVTPRPRPLYPSHKKEGTGVYRKSTIVMPGARVVSASPWRYQAMSYRIVRQSGRRTCILPAEQLPSCACKSHDDCMSVRAPQPTFNAIPACSRKPVRMRRSSLLHRQHPNRSARSRHAYLATNSTIPPANTQAHRTSPPTSCHLHLRYYTTSTPNPLTPPRSAATAPCPNYHHHHHHQLTRSSPHALPTTVPPRYTPHHPHPRFRFSYFAALR